MNREERYEFTYINSEGKEKTEQARDKVRLNRCLDLCRDMGLKVVRTRKLYPFSTMKHQHDFDHINNICRNTMYDMEIEEIPWDSKEYARLEETAKKAEEFFCLPLPVVWVPWEKYKEMKELVVASINHRDRANALAREKRRQREQEWRPGDARWNAPGMSAKDFVR